MYCILLRKGRSEPVNTLQEGGNLEAGKSIQFGCGKITKCQVFIGIYKLMLIIMIIISSLAIH